MKNAALAALAFAALAFVAACGLGPSQQAVSTLNRGNGGEPDTLDPAFAERQVEINIVQDMLLGLFTPGPDGRPIAGAAERWDTSVDGLTWTFHLRAHQWSDGVPVTADDFVFAWRRVLDPKTAVDYASLLYPFKNAQAVNAGKIPPEQLGARALDAQTLELTLEHPAPYLPELLTHSIALPVPRHVVEVKSSGWTKPGAYVSNGPYVLSEWLPNDHITLSRSSTFYDHDKVAIARVNYYPTADSMAALKRMRAGEIDTQTPLPAQQIDWLRANMASALRAVPDLVVYYIDINLKHAALSDVRVREALNLALDREVLVGKIRKLGEPAAYGIVPPGVANYPSGAVMAFKDMKQTDRVARAQALMRAAGYGPEHPMHLTYVTPGGSDAMRLAPVFQAMWHAAYIDIDIVALEARIVSQRKTAGDFDLAYSSWIADYDDAFNFLGLRLSSTSRMNDSFYANPAFDALLDEAQGQRDVLKRGAALREAEEIALKDFPWIPYRFGVTPDLVAPRVKGWIPNAKNVNLTRWLAVGPGTYP